MFLHTSCVWPIFNHTVKQHHKGKYSCLDITATLVGREYFENIEAVDKNDRDSTDYATSIITNQYYLWIFCKGLDRVIYIVYVVVIFCAYYDIGDTKWKKYDSKNGGSCTYQINISIELINFALSCE